MAIVSAVCDSYTQEILSGVHLSTDTYKIALYTSNASLDASTTTYTTTEEISGTGYTAGGNTLTGFTTYLDSGVAILDFDDSVWSSATFTANGALIYNSSQSNKAVAVIAFGSDISTSGGDFTVQMPAPDATNGLIRIS